VGAELFEGPVCDVFAVVARKGRSGVPGLTARGEFPAASEDGRGCWGPSTSQRLHFVKSLLRSG